MDDQAQVISDRRKRHEALVAKYRLTNRGFQKMSQRLSILKTEEGFEELASKSVLRLSTHKFFVEAIANYVE